MRVSLQTVFGDFHKRCARPACNKPFEPKTIRGKYCSDICRVMHNREITPVMCECGCVFKVGEGQERLKATAQASPSNRISGEDSILAGSMAPSHDS